MINKSDFAKKLISLRLKCGLSQSRLADMLFISGQAISKWENGNSLPDIELLPPLAQILGVSVDYLLGSNDTNGFENSNAEMKQVISSYDISDKNIGLLTAMSETLPREYLYKTAKYIEKELLEYKISIALTSVIDGEKMLVTQEINAETLNQSCLNALSKPLSSLTLRAINKSYNPVQDIIELMKCPHCGKNLEYTKDSDNEYISCGEHIFYINDGVVDFKTLEMQGYTWSSWIRCYDDYKKQWGIHLDEKIKDIDDLGSTERGFVSELRKLKPHIIFEVGSGCASGIRKFMKFIDWECIIVLSDLSHRILKYGKRYIDENMINPMVKTVYLACDVRNMPFKDASLPCIISFGGYESVIFDFSKPINESVRVLTQTGKALFSIGLVSDKKDEGTQKWLRLINSENDDIMQAYYKQIYDINEWHKLINSFGFSSHTLTKMCDEIPPPNDDIFPYDCEISRWMASAFVVAEK